MDFAACHLSGTHNLEAASKFLEKMCNLSVCCL